MPRKKTKPTRSTRRDLDAAAQQVGQDKPRDMKSTGPAREALDPPQIETVEHVDHEKLEQLKFAEDVLTVVVHDSTDENADPIPSVQNNGKAQYFIRGQEQEVKRKYVELLARAKIKKYSQRLVKDAAGNDTYRNVPHTALRFPFSVTRDPAGSRGEAWLKRILAEE